MVYSVREFADPAYVIRASITTRGAYAVSDDSPSLVPECKQVQDGGSDRRPFLWREALDWAYTGWAPADQNLDRLIDRFKRLRN